MLLWLLACDGISYRPPPCPTWEEIEVTNPDGAAAEDDFAAVEETLVAFSSWTGGDPLCVEEVRLAAVADEDDDGVAGSYNAAEDLIIIGLDTSLGVHWITMHELCHAWDDRRDFSDDHPDLFPPDPYLSAERYPTDRARRHEVFADRCESGPPPRAVTEAASAACGNVDPVDRLLLDEVFPAYAEALAIEVGGNVTATPQVVPAPEWEASVFATMTSGNHITALFENDASKLATFDPRTLSWSAAVEIPPGPVMLLATLPDAAPMVATSPDGGSDIIFLELHNGALADPGLGWMSDLFTQGASLTVSADQAVWQVWGDGEPLQQRLRAGGEAVPVPGDDGLVLSPTNVGLEGGQLVWGLSALAPHRQAYILDASGVAPLDVPVGVEPVAMLPDGGLLATATWNNDTGYTRSWVARDAAGTWRFPPSACPVFAAGKSFVTVDGRVFASSPSGGSIAIDEIVVD